MVVESVDEKEESGGFSLLSLADRLFAHYVTLRNDDEEQAAVVEIITEHDDTAQSAEATVSITYERSDVKNMWLERAYVQFGELHLVADQIEIEIEPTVEAGLRLEVVPFIIDRRQIEVKVELLPEVQEESATPLTVRFESGVALGKWVAERGDAEGEEGPHGVHLRSVREVGALRQYLSTIAFRHALETTAEYHVLRQIYVDAKEGQEAEVEVLVEVEEDESGDQ